MSYAVRIPLSLGDGNAGLTLKAALTADGATPHATVRDVDTTFVDLGEGLYTFVSGEVIPDDFEGFIVFYTGSVGAATDFDDVEVYATAGVEPSGGGLTEEQAGQLAAAAEGNTGSGADEVTLHFETEAGDDIADADVWVTSDEAGADVVAGTLQTDSDGNVTFLLDDGNSYYAWLQKDGINPIRAQAFTAEAD